MRDRHPKGARVPLATIVSYVAQVADALHYAHQERIIHRDVKSANMLVGRHGDILLSDFGIALLAQSSRYQGTQQMAGTMAYIAPEQIQGHPRAVSDQYALGISVYEWLSGAVPFRGNLTEIVSQHLAATPPHCIHAIPTFHPPLKKFSRSLSAKTQRTASAPSKPLPQQCSKPASNHSHRRQWSAHPCIPLTHHSLATRK